MKTKFSLFLIPGLLISNINAVYGSTTTASLLVSATVINACSVTSGTLAFGSYSTLNSSPTNATASISVTCTLSVPYNVGLDAGTGTGATVAARKMTNGASTLTYSIYQDSGHTTVWGNTIGTNTVTGTGTGLLQTLTAYGQIPASQVVLALAYTDTVTVTVTY